MANSLEDYQTSHSMTYFLILTVFAGQSDQIFMVIRYFFLSVFVSQVLALFSIPFLCNPTEKEVHKQFAFVPILIFCMLLILLSFNLLLFNLLYVHLILN